ncbi:uncharacterized protein B0I36DRAFT_338101 [Microdochium trichocladiopsis]|uniref:Chromo domain-containing protein n=1 Tax=Microdochium trichocladiopsis TaxID=1682393 RepID=A0A9P8XTN9_9PEZI|nr:uncharacterized protein B0I36DRAFT_338101 [Microdochium trichocladiopsis]KAH7016560.1 hypothetical protein B0I36DRAFT_338101 [Microdochium trichocladiopsis]
MYIDDECNLSDTEGWVAHQRSQEFEEASQCDGLDVVSSSRDALPCLSVAADPPRFLTDLAYCLYLLQVEQHRSGMLMMKSCSTGSTIEDCAPEPCLQRLITTGTQPTTTSQFTVYAESPAQADTVCDSGRSVALGTADKVPGSQVGPSLSGARRNPVRCTRTITTVASGPKSLRASRGCKIQPSEAVLRREIDGKRQPNQKTTMTTRRRAKIQARLEARKKYPFERLLEKWGNKFLVKWENGEITWEPEANFDPEDVKAFEKQYRGFGPGVKSILGSREQDGRKQLLLAWCQRPLSEAHWVDESEVLLSCLRKHRLY